MSIIVSRLIGVEDPCINNVALLLDSIAAVVVGANIISDII